MNNSVFSGGSSCLRSSHFCSMASRFSNVNSCCTSSSGNDSNGLSLRDASEPLGISTFTWSNLRKYTRCPLLLSAMRLIARLVFPLPGLPTTAIWNDLAGNGSGTPSSSTSHTTFGQRIAKSVFCISFIVLYCLLDIS
jgi:hypothetical protein